MHICRKDFQEYQEVDVEEEVAYVLDLEDSFAERVEKEPVIVLENAMEEVDAKFSTGEKICWEPRNKSPNEWGANALMYMLLSVAIKWAG